MFLGENSFPPSLWGREPPRHQGRWGQEAQWPPSVGLVTPVLAGNRRVPPCTGRVLPVPTWHSGGWRWGPWFIQERPGSEDSRGRAVCPEGRLFREPLLSLGRVGACQRQKAPRPRPDHTDLQGAPCGSTQQGALAVQARARPAGRTAVGHAPLCWLGQLGTWCPRRPAQHPGCPGHALSTGLSLSCGLSHLRVPLGVGTSGSTDSSEVENSLETVWVRRQAQMPQGQQGGA